jgi:threonine dehydratase
MNAADVERAAERLRGVPRRTPLVPSERLTSELGVSVLLKREDLQIGRSYKVRGAFNLISSLSDAERMRRVICASAGNDAQGVAYSCRRLHIEGRIFVPTTTPRQKCDGSAPPEAGRSS